MFLIRLMFSPVKIVLLVARIMGYNRFVVFLIGVAVGLLVAPTTGAEMREKLRQQIDQRMDRVSEPTEPADVISTPGITPET